MALTSADRHPFADLWCEFGCDDNRECYREHSAVRLGRAKGKVGRLKYECVVCGKHEMQFNPGDDHWMIWRCFCGCDLRAIRDGLLARGIPPKCLGNYMSDVDVARSESGHPRLRRDAELAEELAAVRGKYEALQKLIAGEGPALLRMGARRIDEGDGDLPGRLDALLPVRREDAAEFYALAERADIGRSRYSDAERWFAKQVAGINPVSDPKPR